MASAEDAMSIKEQRMLEIYRQKVLALEKDKRALEVALEQREASLKHVDKLLQQSANETAAQAGKCAALCKENEELKERLKWAERRLTESLEAANNAAIATGAVSRLTNSLSMLFDTLEVKLGEDKTARLRHRG
jgi:hypothetical protein